MTQVPEPYSRLVGFFTLYGSFNQQLTIQTVASETRTDIMTKHIIKIRNYIMGANNYGNVCQLQCYLQNNATQSHCLCYCPVTMTALVYKQTMCITLE